MSGIYHIMDNLSNDKTVLLHSKRRYPIIYQKNSVSLFLSVKNLIFEKSDFGRFLFLPLVTFYPRRIPSRQLNQIFPIGILHTTSYADMIFKHKTEFPSQQKAGKKQNSTKDFIERCYPPKRQ